jgi:hypothetical protein
MVCPRCNGTGRVAARFLFFRWTMDCRRCRAPQQSGSSPLNDGALNTTVSLPAVDTGKPDVESWSGGGGRAGGAGASTGWDSGAAPSESAPSAPLIVDPFADAQVADNASAATTDPSDSSSVDEAGEGSVTSY